MQYDCSLHLFFLLFRIETIDGTAEANSDYIPVKQTMVFEPDETVKHIDIEIIDDNEWEPDEVFFVKLALDPAHPSFKSTSLGKKAIQEVTIINDDGKTISVLNLHEKLK